MGISQAIMTSITLLTRFSISHGICDFRRRVYCTLGQYVPWDNKRVPGVALLSFAVASRVPTFALRATAGKQGSVAQGTSGLECVSKRTGVMEYWIFGIFPITPKSLKGLRGPNNKEKGEITMPQILHEKTHIHHAVSATKTG